MGFLSGKSKSKTESGNYAWPQIQEEFSPWIGQGTNATNALGGILTGNTAEHNQMLDNYWKSSGGDFLLNQGLDGLMSRYSGMGLRQSGAAMKGMEDYRQGLASTKLDNYLGQLRGLSQLGLGAGGLITQAGQWSKGSSKNSEGLGGLIGSLATAAAMASARELKTDIQEIGAWDDRGDGLKKYRFRYKSDPNKTMIEGVMADEVLKLRPWAYVPNFTREGKPGVNYAALGAFA